MAVRGRNTKPVVKKIAPKSMDFFELLRQLETPKKRFGRGAGGDPARLGQPIRLAFAASDVVSVSGHRGENGPPDIAVNVLGLFGPEGPMPLHLTRWMIERASNRWFSGDDENATSDTAFLDFGNVLQHRMIALYWRAWADCRPEVQISHGKGGVVAAMIRSLAGVGLTEPGDRNHERSGPKLHHATSLFQQVRFPDRLTEYLATVTGVRVTLQEFVGVWTEIPKNLQSRLGRQSACLGKDAVVGARFFERQGRAKVLLGPLSLEDYSGFLDDSRKKEDLRHALVFAVGHDTAFDVCLLLRTDEVPEPRLGATRLGQISWLGRPEGEIADDKVFRDFTCKQMPEVAA